MYAQIPTGLKQSSDLRYYLHDPRTRRDHHVDPPVKMRIVGKFSPKQGEELIRLERYYPADDSWIPV